MDNKRSNDDMLLLSNGLAIAAHSQPLLQRENTFSMLMGTILLYDFMINPMVLQSFRKKMEDGIMSAILKRKTMVKNGIVAELAPLSLMPRDKWLDTSELPITWNETGKSACSVV